MTNKTLHHSTMTASLFRLLLVLSFVSSVLSSATRDAFKLFLNDLDTHPQVHPRCPHQFPGSNEWLTLPIPIIFLFVGERQAVCLDGSPGGFWFSPGVGTGASKWLIHTQGGGWCSDLNDCAARSQMYLGSSTSWARAVTCPDAPQFAQPW